MLQVGSGCGCRVWGSGIRVSTGVANLVQHVNSADRPPPGPRCPAPRRVCAGVGAGDRITVDRAFASIEVRDNHSKEEEKQAPPPPPNFTLVGKG
jgi:hypothetical protein